MDDKWYSVHRLVAAAFIPNPNEYGIVNHLDNDPCNNAADNLEWTTYEGNMQWAAKQGRMKGHPSNLLKAVESHKVPVYAITPNGERFYFGSQTEAANSLGIAHGHIAAACRKEYGYKTVGGYEWEYADSERQAAAKPNKIGMSANELREFKRARMMGNTIMNGRKLSEETKRKLSERGRRIIQYSKDGTEIARFISANDARRNTGITHTEDVANGKRKSAGGYLWKWG